jgi:hypothetical protein
VDGESSMLFGGCSFAGGGRRSWMLGQGSGSVYIGGGARSGRCTSYVGGESSVRGGRRWCCIGMFVRRRCWSFAGAYSSFEAGVVGWGSCGRYTSNGGVVGVKGGYSFTGGACRSGAGSWSGFLFR